MLKTTFISINLLGICFLSLLNIGKVQISHESNPKLVAGNQTEVTITINKENFSGPGRIKLDFGLADGLTATELDNDGSSFTFDNNEALFIWYAIPTNETITIKYIVSANSTSLGNKKISGTFSYLDENERKQIKIPDLFIEVIDQENATVNNNVVSCSRSIEASDNYFIVSVHTNKQQQKGFARIKDNIPPGFTAEPIETAGAVFKNIDNSAKFLWSELPSSLESFTVSYKLIPPSNYNEDFEITGKLSAEFLISQNANSNIDIPATKYTYPAVEIAYTNPEQNIDSTNLTTESKPVIEQEIATTQEEEKEELEEAVNPKEEISTSIPETNTIDLAEKSNETENKTDQQTASINTTNELASTNNTTSIISYKVQILAAHKVANQKYFSARHQYNKGFDIENHEGWVKYTTGEFNEYLKARNKREDLSRYNFPGPFVTAYNNGNRITVQEALMTSKQDWIQ